MRRFVANSWFGALQQPRFAIPLPAFVVVGGVYLLVGVMRYRALERQNATAARLGLIVLVLNEIWNLAFFGARSTRNAFVGCLVFAERAYRRCACTVSATAA